MKQEVPINTGLICWLDTEFTPTPRLWRYQFTGWLNKGKKESLTQKEVFYLTVLVTAKITYHDGR
jgi:hypothetical protein